MLDFSVKLSGKNFMPELPLVMMNVGNPDGRRDACGNGAWITARLEFIALTV